MISHAIEGRILIIKAEGHYTSDDVRAALEAALSDPELPPNARLLVDARQSTANPTLKDIQVRLALLKGLRPHVDSLCAMVVSDALHLGLARVYQAQSEMHKGPRIEVFGDIQAAKDWLLGQ